MIQIRSARPLLVLALIALATIASARSASAADERCFPETGQCIGGRFRSFWESNGGLPVFGYPISAPKQEINAENGQPYLTQWFQRNRFELHPDQPPPYDVLLGRLGDDRLQRQAVDWQALPHAPEAAPGCLWFAQTRHNVCDQADGIGFKSYWLAHGLRDPQLNNFQRSLALFGLPLSEATVEVNSTDGQPYLTQSFERARFEWHPELPDEYKVLLGLLGSELYINNGQRLSATMIGQPAARHPYIYYTELEDGKAKLYGVQVEMRARLLVSDLIDPSVAPATNGLAVAWVAPGPDGSQKSVLLYQPPSRGYIPPTTSVVLDGSSAGSLQISGLAVDYNKLYYTDHRSNHQGLYARNLGDGQEELIDPRGLEPVARDGILLWSTRTTNGQTGPSYRETWSLQMRKMDTGEQRILTSIESVAQGQFSGYSVAGDTIVWAFSSASADNRVYLYHIGSGSAAPISPDAAGSPSTDGGRVAWATDPLFDRDPGTTWSVQVYDLNNGTISTVAHGFTPQLQRSVALLGNHVVFTVDNVPLGAGAGSSKSLYLADLP